MPTEAIARRWSGLVANDQANEYLTLMRTVALADYRSTPGNLGAWVLVRRQGSHHHEFTTMSFWESVHAIRAFAGDDETLAKYYDFDPAFLVDLPERAEHYQVYFS